MEDVGCQLHQKMAEFLKKMQETGRSHIGNALGNVCIANNRNNTYNCNSTSYDCYGTTSTQWSYSEKCWPCQDLNRNQVTKKQKQNRKKGRKKECEDRNRGVRIITKNFYS